MKLAATLLVSAGLLCAQEPNPTQNLSGRNPDGQTPIFRVTVTSRTIKAVNYHHRQGTSKVDLRGTALLPLSRGEVRVDSNTGATKMHVDVNHMSPATQFGPEYLTYVLWAVTPEGNAKNLGEIYMKGNGSNAQLDATTDLQSFGLIVTAEPYWAVSQPSDVVVMENQIREDTTGIIQSVEAKYELLQRGTYTMNIRPDTLVPMTQDSRVPLQLREAREAIAIARAQGAERYANDTLQKALVDLENAEGYLRGKSGNRPLETVAREAAQFAEDARLISIRSEREEELAAERKAAADRTAAAQAQAEAESQRRAQADAARAQADNARAQADAARLAAEQSAAQSNAAAAESARQAQEAARQRAEADAARQAALQQQQQAEEALAKAKAAAAQAETEKTELRQRLQQQLNVILETRDTARGLIVNMSDVLFDFNKATLKPAFREKLAKVSGILLAYPSLHLALEGHTDSIGTDEYNMVLSQKRADAVRDYLVGNGINGANVTAQGMGKADPVAPNDTDAGRAQNRRVEMVVSGDLIGSPVNKDQPTTPSAQRF